MVMAVASIMVMIITLNFLSDLIETDKIGSLFFTCIALLIIADRQLKAGSKIDLPND
jgi:Tfp pilus assembly protein FimT